MSFTMDVRVRLDLNEDSSTPALYIVLIVFQYSWLLMVKATDLEVRLEMGIAKASRREPQL